MYNKIIKRWIDLVLSGIGILLLTLLMGIIALIIKITNPGPVLFKQKE